mmetsp:Transcript_78786/g.189041  ORF Transcript_78786/g.189041 Transcript_78786/m.189041 type:complete len:309 (+) Transcript_78786:963-1889(+)
MEDSAQLIVSGLTGVAGRSAPHRAAMVTLLDLGLSRFRPTPLERHAKESRNKLGSAAMHLALCIARCLIGLSGLLARSLVVPDLWSARGQSRNKLRMVALALARTICTKRNIVAWTHAQLIVPGMIGAIGMLVLLPVEAAIPCVPGLSELQLKGMVRRVREVGRRTGHVSRSHVRFSASGKTGKTGQSAPFPVARAPASAHAFTRLPRQTVACPVKVNPRKLASAMLAHVPLPASGAVGVIGNVQRPVGRAPIPGIDPCRLQLRMVAFRVTAKALKAESACFKSIVPSTANGLTGVTGMGVLSPVGRA